MLPAEKKESIFDKIKTFFKNLFKTQNQVPKTFKEEQVNSQEINNHTIEIDAENYEPNYKTIDDVEGSFAESLKVEDKSYILFLQQKLKNNEIRIEDLSDQELDDMIALYKSQLQVA